MSIVTCKDCNAHVERGEWESHECPWSVPVIKGETFEKWIEWHTTRPRPE